jgi:hypothetical protein
LGPKKEAVEPGKELAVRGHLLIDQFRQEGEGGNPAVTPEKPALRPARRERAEGGVRSGVNRAVGQNEVEGFRKILPGNFGIFFCDRLILVRQIINGVPGGALPAGGPAAAESAIAVENEERFGRG